MRSVVKTKAISIPGWIFCEFDNGKQLLVDIRPSMEGKLDKLKDDAFFQEVSVDEEAGTIAWPGELYIDADTLYEQGISIKELAALMNAEKNNQ